VRLRKLARMLRIRPNAAPHLTLKKVSTLVNPALTKLVAVLSSAARMARLPAI
jgi:hypothetical protein